MDVGVRGPNDLVARVRAAVSSTIMPSSHERICTGRGAVPFAALVFAFRSPHPGALSHPMDARVARVEPVDLCRSDMDLGQVPKHPATVNVPRGFTTLIAPNSGYIPINEKSS